MNATDRPMSVPTRCSSSLLVIAMLLTAAAAQAANNEVKGWFDHPLPRFEVVGNGESYTLVKTGPSQISLEAIADATDSVRNVHALSFEASAQIILEDGPTLLVGQDSGSYEHEFGFKWSDKKKLVGTIPVDKAALVAGCNLRADQLRAEGKSNAEIFGSDQLLTVYASGSAEADFNELFDQPAAIFQDDLELVCAKWAGTAQDAAQAISPQHGVHNAVLTIEEESNLAGLCRLKLQSTIESTASLMKVKFRYVHGDGQQSGVKTLTTSDAGTAIVQDTIQIPIVSGPEAGTLQIVGVDPSFSSNVVPYEMACGGPQGFELSQLPTASLKATPVGAVSLSGQTCPSHLNVQGAIAGHGGGTTAGRAFFIGPDFESDLKDYSVDGGETVFLNQLIPLSWPTLSSLAPTAGATEAKTQTLVLGFNVLGNQNAEVAKVPQRGFDVACQVKLTANAVPSAQIAMPKATSPPVAQIRAHSAVARSAPKRSPGTRTKTKTKTRKGLKLAAQRAAPARVAPAKNLSVAAAQVVRSAKQGLGRFPANDAVRREVRSEAKATRRALSELSKTRPADVKGVSRNAQILGRAVDALSGAGLGSPRKVRTCAATARSCASKCAGALCTCKTQQAACLAPLLGKRDAKPTKRGGLRGGRR